MYADNYDVVRCFLIKKDPLCNRNYPFLPWGGCWISCFHYQLKINVSQTLHSKCFCFISIRKGSMILWNLKLKNILCIYIKHHDFRQCTKIKVNVQLFLWYSNSFLFGNNCTQFNKLLAPMHGYVLLVLPALKN